MRPPGVLDLAPGIVLRYLPLALAILAVLGVGLFAIRSRRVPRAEAARVTALDLFLGIWLALTLLVTVVPLGDLPFRPPVALIPFVDAIQRVTDGLSSPGAEAADLVLNVLLFVPFGAAAALRWGRARMGMAIAVAAALSIGIELSQAVEALGRFASTTDVITNTAGATLGFELGDRIRVWRRATVDERRDRDVGQTSGDRPGP